MQRYFIQALFAISGGVVIWIMIFLAIYPHFPRMEKQKRIVFSVLSATIAALALAVMLFVSAYLIINFILK